MNKKTIAASISAPTIGGVLAGAEQTMTAPSARRSATSPAYYIGRPASFWLRALSPRYTKDFRLTNGFCGVTLELVRVEGHQEGVPPIGSTIGPGQWQDFEVRYTAGATGYVLATYQINDSTYGFVGDVEIQMSYGCFGETKTTIALNNSLVGMSLGGSSTDAIVQPGNQ